MSLFRPVTSFLTPTFVLSTLAATALIGCGGSGGLGLEAATTTVTGTTTPGATVTIGTSAGQVTATADANGLVTKTVETSTLNTNTAIIVTVSKTGSETCTTTLNGVTSAGTNTVTLTGCNPLTALAVGEYSPADGASITRLGDGAADGDANSKLQLPASAAVLTKTIKIGSPSGLALSTYSKFTVTADFRGLQGDVCADSVTIFQSADGTIGTVKKVFDQTSTPILGASDASGLVSSKSFELNIASTGITTTGGDLYVKLVSGACAIDKADDFEFLNIKGKFGA